ncbi:MAG: GNAT family N-acetyltransferase [Chitinophagaceae bacterium]|nr:GNAT family N-acetyltransferase [Chitinophagaceae bacterium]
MMEKLDNVVWHCLQETHKEFALDYGSLLCYDPDHCPFGAFAGSPEVAEYVDQYASLISDFYIVGQPPRLSDKLEFKNELVCLQMLTERPVASNITEAIMPLNGVCEQELFDLVTLVQPGFIKTKTSLLGNYYGIFKNNQLVAVTGERMQMHGFTEISAVVTHPEHTGKGYAKQLLAYTTNRILEQNKIPFLHVNEKNTGAIQLYLSSGFATRRKMSFWNIGCRV